jgi:hypothetical protein
MILPLLDSAQFTQADVMAVTGLTYGQLKGILDRAQVRLRSDHFPGSGRRRMFCGSDILKFATAAASNSIGFPLRWASLLADQVAMRADARAFGLELVPGQHFAMAVYPCGPADNWVFVPVHGDEPVSPLPLAFQVINVDRLINETMAKLEAIASETKMPDFSTPEPKDENPFSPEVDFFRVWTKDAAGQNCYHGLTHEETIERAALRQLWLHDAKQKPDARGATAILFHRTHEARLDELDEIHRAAHRQSEIEHYRENPPKIISEAE